MIFTMLLSNLLVAVSAIIVVMTVKLDGAQMSTQNFTYASNRALQLHKTEIFVLQKQKAW